MRSGQLAHELAALHQATDMSFGKLKQFHRVATRYDKLQATYEGFVQLAAAAILLR